MLYLVRTSFNFGLALSLGPDPVSVSAASNAALMLKGSGPSSIVSPTVASLKIFKPCLLPNGKSDKTQTWWEALG